MSIDLAVVDILNGNKADAVIEKLLDEKSMWVPSGKIDIPFKVHPIRVPGGLTGIGAVVGGAYKGYRAHKRAKARGLRGKESAKEIAKEILKGAAGGAVAGYAAQLGQRVARSKKTQLRHLKRRAYKAYRTQAQKESARRALRRRSARGGLGAASAIIGFGRRALGQ